MAVVVAVCREIKMKHQQDVGVCVCVCVCFFFRIELSTNMNDKAEHEKKESLCCVAANPICNKQPINQSCLAQTNYLLFFRNNKRVNNGGERILLTVSTTLDSKNEVKHEEGEGVLNHGGERLALFCAKIKLFLLFPKIKTRLFLGLNITSHKGHATSARSFGSHLLRSVDLVVLLLL